MHKEVSRKQSAKMLIWLSLYFDTKKNSILFHYNLTRVFLKKKNCFWDTFFLPKLEGVAKCILLRSNQWSVCPILFSTPVQTWCWESQRWNRINLHLQWVVRKKSRCCGWFQPGLEVILVRRKCHLSSEQMQLPARAHSLVSRSSVRRQPVSAPSDTLRVQFSRSVVSNCLRPHGLQHIRPPCPSPTLGVDSNSCPLS